MFLHYYEMSTISSHAQCSLFRLDGAPWGGGDGNLLLRAPGKGVFGLLPLQGLLPLRHAVLPGLVRGQIHGSVGASNSCVGNVIVIIGTYIVPK